MLQQPEPDDFVVATGETHSVKEFLQLACEIAGIPSWESLYEHDNQYDRPAEVDYLIGDASKAKQKFGWTPKTPFKELVRIMVEAELNLEKNTNV